MEAAKGWLERMCCLHNRKGASESRESHHHGHGAVPAKLAHLTPDWSPKPRLEKDGTSTSDQASDLAQRPIYLSHRECAALLSPSNHGLASTLNDADGPMTRGASEAFNGLDDVDRLRILTTVDRLRIAFSEVTAEQLKGSSSCKSVHRARWNNTNVALISMMKGGRIADAYMMQAIQIWSNLSHPNLVQFYRWASEDQGIEHMIVEWVKMGALDKILLSEGTTLPVRVKIASCEQVCSAMCELASQGILHRDLAARNILVASLDPVHVKVSNFGLTWSDSPRSNHSCEKHVPVRWSPPEVLERCEWSEKSDVWSFGVTMWEIFSNGNEPYAQLQLSEAFTAIRKRELLPRPATCPLAIYHMMLSCWEKDPERRPTFEKLHRVFQSWRRSSMVSSGPSLQSQANDLSGSGGTSESPGFGSGGSGGSGSGGSGTGGSGGSGSKGSGGQSRNESGYLEFTKTVKARRGSQATQETPVAEYVQRNSGESDRPAIAENVTDQEQSHKDKEQHDLVTQGHSHQRVECISDLPVTDLPEQGDPQEAQECNSEPWTCEASEPSEHKNLESQTNMQDQASAELAAVEAEAQKQVEGGSSCSNDDNSGTSGDSSSGVETSNKARKRKARNTCDKCRVHAVGMSNCWCNFCSTAADLDDYCLNGLQLDGVTSDGGRSAKLSRSQ